MNKLPLLSFCMESSPFPISACSSATKDVVILSKGTLNTLDTRLNTAAETPTAANSTDPVQNNSLDNNDKYKIERTKKYPFLAIIIIAIHTGMTDLIYAIMHARRTWVVLEWVNGVI